MAYNNEMVIAEIYAGFQSYVLTNVAETIALPLSYLNSCMTA